MRIYEHEAKDLLQAASVPVPRRGLTDSADEALRIAEKIGCPVAIKAQTLIKARGKAGLIAFADRPDQAAAAAKELLERRHHREPVKAVLIEEKIDFEKEMYLGVAIDYTVCRPMIIVSPDGGVDIEETGRNAPDRIKKIPVSPSAGLSALEAGQAAEFMTRGLSEARAQAVDLIRRVYDLFTRRDLEMLEINPLVYKTGRGLVALDGAAAVDEEALQRQPDLVAPRGQSPAEFEREQDFRKRGWSYLQFDGDIGLLSSGAGVTMAILDLMRQSGGRPANFLDTAQMNRQGIYDAFRIFYGDQAIKTVLVNIFAGLNRCDDLALGIRDFLAEYQPDFGLVVRMVGNREDEGRKILEQIGLRPLRGLEETIARAIEVTEERS